MTDYKRIELLVKISKLYYESDYSQEMIAKEMKLSRPYISKLLNEAKELGIVKFQVVDPLSVETYLEKEIRERFRLKKVNAVPRKSGTNATSLQRLGIEAARFLGGVVQDGDIIGTSWGETLFECSKALIPRMELHNIISVQLCGGISNLDNTVYASEIAKNFSEILGSDSYLLPLPAIVDNKRMKTTIEKDHHMSRILQFGCDANIAIFTMGTFGMRNSLVRAGFLEKEMMHFLSEKGAVGDICSHIIDIHGEICDRELDERTIAVPLEIIKRKEYRIGVAQGASKVESICGALNGGILNVLITNEDTLEWVAERLDK